MFAAVQPLYALAANSATSLGQVSVTASQNDIFNAGHPTPPLGDGFPVKVTLPAGSAGKAIEISDAVGGVTQGVNPSSSSPDGGYDPDLAMNINSYHGISGVIADAGLGGFLAGVFTSDAEPSGAGPDRLDYTAATGKMTTTQVVYQPALDQLYFIGDGLTGTGTGQQQQFIVPAGATTLWLGVADAGYYQGDPIPTTGNTGGFTASLSLASVTGSGNGFSLTPSRGTVTTPFVATISCPTGSTPQQFTFFLTSPDGTRVTLKQGPDLVIESNFLTTGSYSRTVTFKVGPDLALAQAYGFVNVQGGCSGMPSTVQVIQVVQTPFAVIGDSYSAGEGDRPFTLDTDLNPSGHTATGCHRSSTGWAYKVAAASGYANPSSTADEPITWTFAACSGADLPDLTRANTAYSRYGESEVAQLNALTVATKTVAMTDGGNDVGFANILAGCLVGPFENTSEGCRDKNNSVRKSTDKALKKLPDDLVKAYTAIAGRMAPDGTMYVAGYPHLFGSDQRNYADTVYNSHIQHNVPACDVDASKHYAIGYADAQWINQATDQGDQIIANAVAQVNQQLVAAHSGRRIVFVGVPSGQSNAGQGGAIAMFAGHGLCDSGASYINGLFLDVVHHGPFQTSFHPNLNGQTAYARAFEQYMSLPLSNF